MALHHLHLLLLPLLQAFWLIPAHSYVLNTRQSLITAAAVLNHFEERQNVDQVTCSQWSILGGGGVPVCSAGRTCIFNYGIPFWGCYPAAQTGDVFATACYDWPTTYTDAGEQTLFCASSAPSCGVFLLENTSGGTYTNLGCSVIPYDLVATQVEAFTTPQPAAPTTVYVPASAASPVTVTVSASNAAATAVVVSASKAAPTTATATSPAPFPITSSTDFPTSSSIAAPSTSSTSSGGGGSSGSTSSNAATIGGAVGGAVGGLALIAAAIFIWLFLRKQRRKATMEQSSKEPGIQSPGPSTYSAPSAPFSPRQTKQMANC